MGQEGERSKSERCSSSEPASQTRSLKMGCPPGATAQWQQVYSRTCMTPPTRAQEYPALSRIASKRRLVRAWGGSFLTTDIIHQRGFCVETRPISFELPFTSCSQMQLPPALQAKMQRLEPPLKAATESNSLTRENLKDKEPRGPIQPPSSGFFLSLYGKMGKKKASMYHVIAKWMEQMRLSLSLPTL